MLAKFNTMMNTTIQILAQHNIDMLNIIVQHPINEQSGFNILLVLLDLNYLQHEFHQLQVIARQVTVVSSARHSLDEGIEESLIDQWKNFVMISIQITGSFQSDEENRLLYVGTNQQYLSVRLYKGWQCFLLSNAGMHSTNGNGPGVQQRNQQIAVDTLFEAQALKIVHDVKWDAGDHVLDGVCDWLGFEKKKSESIKTSFKTCEDEGFDILSFLTDEKTILVYLIGSIVIYMRYRNKITACFLCTVLGAMVFLKATKGCFDKIDLVDIHSLWTTVHLDDFEMEPVYEAQTFTFDTPLVSKLLVVALSAVAGYGVKQSFVTGILSCTKITDTQTMNVASMLIYVTTSIHNFLISIKQDKIAQYFEIESIGDDRVSKYQEKVVKFVASFNSGNPESMLFCMDVYKNLYDEGRQLDQALDKRSFDHRVVTDCFNKLVLVYSKIEELKLSLSGERIEPVGILLRGAPSTMKGVLTKRIAKVISMATLPDEWKPAYNQDSRDFFFSVPKDQFWDGYSNKAWITFYDDIFQRRDAAADSDADALKVIDMINSAPYTLKMANISQKNNVFFRSAFLIANSNISDFKQLQSVTDFTAVQRRFHVEVEVKVNPKYLVDGVMQVDKLPFSVDVDQARDIPNDFWVLLVQQREGMKVSKPRECTIQDLIEICVARHHTHRRNYFSNRKAEERLVAELSTKLGYDWKKDYSDGFEFEAQAGSFPDTTHREIMDYFRGMPYHKKAVYSGFWWKFCTSISRTDLAMVDFDVVLKMLVIEGPDLSEMFESMYNPSRFISVLGSITQESIKLGYNPITRTPDWISTPPRDEKPLEKIIEIFGGFVKVMKQNWVYMLLGVVFSAGALTALYKFFSCFYEKASSSSESVDFKTFGKRTVGKKNTIKLSSKLHNRPKVESQSGVPMDFEFSGLPKFSAADFGVRNNHNDVAAKLFNKSLFLTYVVEPSGSEFEVTRLGHSINVVGQLFLMPMHFIYVLDGLRKRSCYKGCTVIFVTSSGGNRYTVPLEEVLLSFRSTDAAADKDVCLVKVNCAQRMAKGCLDSFLTISDLNNLMRTTSFKAHLMGSYHPGNSTSSISIRNHYTRASMNKGGMSISSDWEDKHFVYNLFDTFMYEVSSSKGDCGSILLATESNYENRILCGMHVAGGSGTGIAVCLTREMVEELIELTFPSDLKSLEDELPSFLSELELVESQGSMVPLYKLKSTHVPGEVFKSEIRKSRLYKNLPDPYDKVVHFPSKLKPFYMDDGTLVDPLLKAFGKYGKIAPDIPKELVDSAIESYENLINNHFESDQAFRNVVDLKTALHSFDRINSISSSTSSGFPMSLPGEEDLKKLYFQAIEKRDVLEERRVFERIAILVQDTVSSYEAGRRPFYAYKQCGKDEIRELSKIIEGKTRLFSACPFILLALFRMYFGSFVNDFVKSNSKIGSAVGVNPYSSEWDTIARRLLQFSDTELDEVVAAGDQGQFDTRQWTVIHDSILDMINRYYGNRPEENFIRSCLFKEITNSRHVFRGVIYEWNSGLPSGNPLTAIINTIYNNVVFRMSWGLAGLDVRAFNDGCYLIVLGDDNVFSVSCQYREVFNEMTLPSLMSEIGMEYTTELKGNAVSPFRKLSDVEFLKRSFRKDKQLNRWVAPLRESAIASMLNWTKKGKEGNQITLDNMLFALREFSLHGKDKFEFWREAIVNLKQKYFEFMVPHGDMPLNFESTYKVVLDLEYYF